MRLASARRARTMLNEREERPWRAKSRLDIFCSTGCAVTAFSEPWRGDKCLVVRKVPGTAGGPLDRGRPAPPAASRGLMLTAGDAAGCPHSQTALCLGCFRALA